MWRPTAAKPSPRRGPPETVQLPPSFHHRPLPAPGHPVRLAPALGDPTGSVDHFDGELALPVDPVGPDGAIATFHGPGVAVHAVAHGAALDRQFVGGEDLGDGVALNPVAAGLHVVFCTAQPVMSEYVYGPMATIWSDDLLRPCQVKGAHFSGSQHPVVQPNVIQDRVASAAVLRIAGP